MNITGRELANALHVDYSLISKWKNNKRPLTTRSVYLKKIANYILSQESHAKKEFILGLLKEYEPQLNTASPKDIHISLCRWLSEPPQAIQNYHKLMFGYNKNEYHAGFKVYKENEGRRKATLEFLDYVLDMPEGQQLYLISQEEMSWIAEDSDFIIQWNQKLSEVLKKNHKIKRKKQTSGKTSIRSLEKC